MLGEPALERPPRAGFGSVQAAIADNDRLAPTRSPADVEPCKDYMHNVHMSLRFSWDPTKDRENQRKHGVSFREAASIFERVPLEIFHDPDHSEGEERFIAAGFSERARLLLVVHCENPSGTEIRIISARKATKKERATLFGGAWR